MKPKTVTYKIPDYYSEELQLAILKATEETVNEFLEKLPSVERITIVICKHFGKELKDFFDPSQADEIVYRRHMLFYFLYHYSGLTAGDIGRISKPPYSEELVWHASRAIRDSQYLPEVKKDIEAIRELIS